MGTYVSLQHNVTSYNIYFAEIQHTQHNTPYVYFFSKEKAIRSSPIIAQFLYVIQIT